MKHNQGFTLIEIMVAVAISTMILLFSSSVANVAMKSWSKDSGRLRNNVEARVVFDALKTDFQTAIFRQSPTEWFRLQYDKGVGEASGYQIPQTPWLRFFVPAPDRDDTPGTMAAVSYRMAYEDPIQLGGNFPVFGLYRAITDPEKTHLEAFGSAESVQKFWRERLPATTEPGNFLGNHLVRFDVVVWYWAKETKRGFTDADAKPILKRLPNGTSMRVIGMRVETQPSVAEFAHVSQLHAADIGLTVLTNKGALQIEDGPGDKEDLIKRHGYRYGGRVEFLTSGACLP